MAIGTKCHICGHTSISPRCPRCNALKFSSCTGACFVCRNKQACDSQKQEILSGAGGAEGVEESEGGETPEG